MKKIALIVLATIYSALVIAQTETPPPAAAPAPAPAAPLQTDQGQKVRLGLSFSPVFSWFNASGDAGAVETDGTRTNIAFGLNTDFRIAKNNNYFFSTGIFLLNTGGSIRHDYFAQNDNGDYFLTERTSDFRINYVNIPLTVLLRTNEIGYLRYFGRVGFDASFNTSSTVDYNDVNKDIPNSPELTVEDDDASDFTALSRFGLRVEGGFEYSLGGTANLYVSAAYNSGLNNVFSDDYRLPTGSKNADGLLNVDPNTGKPFVDRKVSATTNFITITAGIYF